MDKKHYSVARVKNTGEVIYFEYDKVKGYRVNPKTKKEDTIGVSKIIFVNDEMSEKIIRRKLDNTRW